MATKITDHVDAAKARLPSYLRKPKIESAIDSFLVSTQSAEDAAWEVFTGTSIDDAVGAQLDLIGKIVDVLRSESDGSDSDYRRHIRVRVSTNRSDGTVADFIACMRIAIDTLTGTVVCTKEPAAGSEVRIAGLVTTEVESNGLIEFLKRAVAAGDRVLLAYQEQLDAATFMTPTVHTFLSAAEVGGNTKLTVVSTALFPSTGTIIVREGATETTYAYTSIGVGEIQGLSPVTVATEDRTAVVLVDGIGLGYGDEPTPSTTGGQLASVKETPRRRDTLAIELLTSGASDDSGAPVDTKITTVVNTRLNPQRARRIFAAVSFYRSAGAATVPTCSSTTPSVTWNLVHSDIGTTDTSLGLAIFETPIDPDVVPVEGVMNSAITFDWNAVTHDLFAWAVWQIDGSSGRGVDALVVQPLTVDAVADAIDETLVDAVDSLHMSVAVLAAIDGLDNENDTHATLVLEEESGGGNAITLLVAWVFDAEQFTCDIASSSQHLLHYYEHFTRWNMESD